MTHFERPALSFEGIRWVILTRDITYLKCLLHLKIWLFSSSAIPSKKGWGWKWGWSSRSTQRSTKKRSIGCYTAVSMATIRSSFHHQCMEFAVQILPRPVRIDSGACREGFLCTSCILAAWAVSLCQGLITNSDEMEMRLCLAVPSKNNAFDIVCPPVLRCT